MADQKKEFSNFNMYSTEPNFFKVHRTIFDHFLGSDPVYFMIWLYCLSKGNYKKKQIRVNGGIYTMNIGYFKSSIREISRATGIERNRVDRTLKLFISKGLIHRYGDNRNTIYEIIDYERYT